MKVKLTTLQAGENFKLDGKVYEKVDRREKSNLVKDLDSGEIKRIPLMATVEKVTAPQPQEESEPVRKPKRVPKRPAKVDDSSGADAETEKPIYNFSTYSAPTSGDERPLTD